MSKKNDDTREIPADELEFGANDTRLRGLPASFADSNDDQTFTLNELEGDIDRSLGPSSDYKQRSVQVTSNYDQEDGLSFVDTFSHQKQYVDTSSASFSSASMDHVIVPEPEPVPPSPYHLDLNTHDVPKSISASKIHAMLLETFDTNKCDILFKTNSWTFVCKNYSNNELINFNVRLYNTSSNIYKLEFQLRDGDRLSYYELMNSMKVDLNLPTNNVSFGYSHFNNSIATNNNNTNNNTATSSSNTSDSKAAPSEEDIKSVVKMVDSKFIDVKIEGLKLAYTFCSNQIILPTFVSHSGIAAILTATNGKNEKNVMEIQRCGASALHMYCSTDTNGGCEALLKAPAGVSTLLRLARMSPAVATGDSKTNFSFFLEEEEEEDDLTHLEVQRQACSALLCLTLRSADAARVVEEMGGHKTFVELQNSGDPRLIDLATKALKQLPSTRTHY